MEHPNCRAEERLMPETFSGGCYCGECTVTVEGIPAMAAYCHCLSCRKWHAAPINAWAIWPADKVSITGPTTTSCVDPVSERISCSKCGGGLANGKPKRSMIVVYPMTLAGSGLTYTPTFHIHYGERAMNVSDGLPKFLDYPEKMGGTGTMADEPEATTWAG